MTLLQPHGTKSRYARSGCRCDVCRAGEAERSRDRYAQRRAAGGRPDPGPVLNVCRRCGVSFNTKRPRTYCNRDCYTAAVGTAPDHHWWVSIGRRLAIYHRDGYRCQLCGTPVEMSASTYDPKAPTLDHITPRARGGTDHPDNLRLAHRHCNVSRGSAVDDYLDGEPQ